MTSVMWVRNLIDALTACGLDGNNLALRAGIKAEALEVAESGVWVKEIVRLWELAVDASGDEAIGLRAACHFRPASLSVLGYAMMSSQSLFEALQRAVRYSGAVSTATTGSLVREADGWHFGFHIMSGVVNIQRQNHDFVVSSFLQFFRWIAGQDLRPVRAGFMHARPADAGPYQRIYDCPVSFGVDHPVLVFSESDVARPLLTGNPLLTGILDRAAEQRALQMGRSQTSQRVRQLIVQALPAGEPSRDEIAARLNISSRSLQRRLQEESQSFHDLLEDVRRNLAENYLGKADVRMSDLAGLLGFSDQSSFTRAVHRWFEASPSKIRAELLARGKVG